MEMNQTTHRKNPYVNRVEERLMALEIGDVITVKWIDASRVTNVKEEEINENRVFASYKTHSGAFYALKLDKVYRSKFLILMLDNHNQKCTVVSIPVSCIRTILHHNKRQAIKHITPIGSPALIGAKPQFPVLPDETENIDKEADEANGEEEERERETE